MAKAKFIGDPNDDFSGPTRMLWQKVEFRKGKFVDVPDALVGKLRTHNHFVVEGDPDPTADVQDEEVKDKVYGVPELRAILRDREVAYGPRMGVKALTELVEANGGLPSDE